MVKKDKNIPRKNKNYLISLLRYKLYPYIYRFFSFLI